MNNWIDIEDDPNVIEDDVMEAIEEFEKENIWLLCCLHLITLNLITLNLFSKKSTIFSHKASLQYPGKNVSIHVR
jgi:predicted negative regulator of RcsB-dependent stress response